MLLLFIASLVAPSSADNWCLKSKNGIADLGDGSNCFFRNVSCTNDESIVMIGAGEYGFLHLADYLDIISIPKSDYYSFEEKTSVGNSLEFLDQFSHYDDFFTEDNFLKGRYVHYDENSYLFNSTHQFQCLDLSYHKHSRDGTSYYGRGINMQTSNYNPPDILTYNNQDLGGYGYIFLYVTNSSNVRDLNVWSNCEASSHTDCNTLFSIYRLEDYSQDFVASNDKLGPFSTVENGFVRVYANNNVNYDYNSHDMDFNLTSGVYLILLNLNDKKMKDSFTYVGMMGGFNISFFDTTEFKYKNFYEPDWFNGKIFDADDYPDLCRQYFGSSAYISSDDLSGLDSSHYCCGDDPDDYGIVWNNFVCTEDFKWGELSPEIFCAQKALSNDLLSTYLSTVVSSDQIIHSVKDGADACCGDDKGFCEGSADSVVRSCNLLSVEDCKSESSCNLKMYTYLSEADFPPTTEKISCAGESYYNCLDIKDAPECVLGYQEQSTSTSISPCITNCGDAVINKEYVAERVCESSSLVSECEGTYEATPVCQSFSDEKSCVESGCLWKNYSLQGDEGFIMTPLGEGGYTDRYLCLQDKAPNDEVVDPLTPIIYKDVGSWRWWDSYGDTPFRIHKLDGVDYISNGDNWSYCDAYGDEGRLAQPVSAYDSFSSSAVDLCAWTPRDFFARKFIDPSDDSSLSLGNYVFTPACDDKSYNQNTIYDAEYNKMLSDHPWLGRITDFNADFYVGCCKTSDHILSDLGWNLFGTDQNSCPEDQGYHCFSRNDGEIIPPPENLPGSCVCVGGTKTSSSCRTGLKAVCSEDDSCSCVDEDYVSEVDKSASLDYSFTVDEDGCDDLGDKFNVVGEVCDLGTSTCVFDSLSEYTRIVPVRTQSLDSRKICCLGGSCESVSGKTCSEIGGFEYSTTNAAISDCDGSVLTSDDGVSFSQGYDSCCLGNLNWVPNSFESVDDVVDAFICYPRSDGLSYFGECCSGTSCFNWLLGQSWDGGYTDGFDRGNVFTVGSSLFSVKSFDKVSDQGLGVEDKIKRFKIVGDAEMEVRDGSLYRIPFYHDDGALNWSDFDYLVFDMSWSGKYKALNITFNFSDHELSFNISKFVARSALPPVIWDRVNIPLKDNNGNSLFDSIPQYAYFTFVLDAPTAVDSYFYVDNFALKEADESFFKDYYCGGKSRKWVAGLEAGPDASSEEVDAYHRACDAQKSSTWTGSRCCGLRSFDVSNPSLSEYYNDSVFGCWAGISVKSSETVSSAYFDPDYYPGIMFYGNKFYACTAGSYPDASPVNGVISIYDLDDYDAGMLKGTDELTPLNLIVKDPFDTIGNYYCDAGTDGKEAVPRWRKTTFLPRAKILASKLYSLVGPDDNFTLFCGNVSEVQTVNALSGLLSGDDITIDEGIATILCALNVHGEDPKIYIGAVLETPSTDPDAFISHIRSFNPLNDSDSFPVSCNSYIDDDGNTIPVDDDVLSASDSFLRCDDSGEDGSGYGIDVDLNVYHQPNLGLVYFSMEGKGKVGFLQSMWEAVVDFFKSLFKSNAGEEVVSESSPLPAIGIDMYYDADFENIYLARQGDMFVKGVVEKINSDGDKELRVDFINFTTLVADSLKSLVDPMVQSTRVYDCENTQTLFAEVGKDDDFDWRYLTSNLRLIPSSSPVKDFGNTCELTNSMWNLHNGVID